MSTGRLLTLQEACNPAARDTLFAFARRSFLTCYNAEIDDDSPVLIGAFDRVGELVSAFGLRTSASGFFCERYLDAPLAQTLSRRFKRQVGADEIVEVTHLCSARTGFLRELVPSLPGILVARGYRYLACTATRCLAHYFDRRGVPSATLGRATADVLTPAERDRWGAYYAAEPRVMAGELLSASAALGIDDLQRTGS